jgi:hypothetical protein
LAEIERKGAGSSNGQNGAWGVKERSGIWKEDGANTKENGSRSFKVLHWINVFNVCYVWFLFTIKSPNRSLWSIPNVVVLLSAYMHYFNIFLLVTNQNVWYVICSNDLVTIPFISISIY